jgi:hypothetical protein
VRRFIRSASSQSAPCENGATLTAQRRARSHCTAHLESLDIPAGDVWVTFSPEASDAQGAALPTAVLLPGTYHTHPDFGFSGPGSFSDPHDIAVIVLDQAYTGATPARLPTRNLLNTLALKRQRFRPSVTEPFAT